MKKDDKKSRREFLTIEAFEPPDGSVKGSVQISYDRMQTVAKRSLGSAKECGFIVPFVLQQPTAVFEGLCQDEDEDRRGVGWRCFCGIPNCAYNQDGSAREVYRDRVYLVFINDDGVAYNWRWEKAAPDDPTLPVDHQTRFSKRIY